MRIYILPADVYGCGHYRLIWPADVLRRMGHDIVLVPPSKSSGFLAKTRVREDGSEELLSVQIPKDMDVLVIQRPAHRLQPQLITMLRANGVAVVVDMDDDMSTIHPRNTAFQMYRTSTATEYSWKYAAQSCKNATMVTTSTAQLQKVYSKPGHGRIIDNYVPEAYLAHPKMETWSFGWAGTMKSHPDDPQVMGDAVRRLVAEGYQFSVVGDGDQVKQALKLPDHPPATGSVSLVEWAARISDTMDVGVVPLAPTSFNSSKSRLKGIEMSAVGVPWVASPRTEYRKLVRESGCGMLADSPKEWHAKVKLLMDDASVRKEHIEAGQTYMRTQTYETNAWRHMEAWTDALKRERGTTE
jgi:glycosyl transferase family 1